MKKIVDVHHPGLKEEMLNRALGEFYKLRKVNGIKKRPSTSELVDWISLILRDDLLKVEPEDGKRKLPPHLGSLIKNEQDLMLLERMLG
ncbi:MAG: MoxR-like ATPase [Bacteroidia bacterium]|jgi:MoxR-like ATPase